MKLVHLGATLPVLAALLLSQTPAWSQPSGTDAKIFAERNSFVGLASQVTPSVVNIDVEKHQSRRTSGLPFDDPAFQRFFGDFPQRTQERVVTGKGSGVIISADGLVLTNNHVVEGASDIKITLQDGRQFTATLVGNDPSTDVAVVKIQANEPLPAAKMGSSLNLPIGSWLMAVGNPYGLEETVTVGILSGKGRVIGAGLYDDFLQTDAAINPGNSGGGLFNSEGELVGINTAVTGQNLGFAIPIEMARRVATDLQAHGKVMRGYLGVGLEELTPELREALKMPTGMKGALLGQILPDGPAARGGLQAGDVVLELDGHPIANERALLSVVAQSSVGKSVPVKVWRDGQQLDLQTPVAERPAEVSSRQPEPEAASKRRSPSPPRSTP